MEKAQLDFSKYNANATFFLQMRKNQIERLRNGLSRQIHGPVSHLQKVRAMFSHDSTNGTERTCNPRQRNNRTFPSLSGLSRVFHETVTTDMKPITITVSTITPACDIPPKRTVEQTFTPSNSNCSSENDTHTSNSAEIDDFECEKLPTTPRTSLLDDAQLICRDLSEKFIEPMPKSIIPNTHCSKHVYEERLLKMDLRESQSKGFIDSCSMTSTLSLPSIDIRTDVTVRKAIEKMKTKCTFFSIVADHCKSMEPESSGVKENLPVISKDFVSLDHVWRRPRSISYTRTPSSVLLRNYKYEQPIFKLANIDRLAKKREEVLKRYGECYRRNCICPMQTVFDDYTSLEARSRSYGEKCKKDGARVTGEEMEDCGSNNSCKQNAITLQNVKTLPQNFSFNINRFVYSPVCSKRRKDENESSEENLILSSKIHPDQKTSREETLSSDEKWQTDKKSHIDKRSRRNGKQYPDEKIVSCQKRAALKDSKHRKQYVSISGENKQLPVINKAAKEPIKKEDEISMTSFKDKCSQTVRFVLPTI